MSKGHEEMCPTAVDDSRKTSLRLSKYDCRTRTGAAHDVGMNTNARHRVD